MFDQLKSRFDPILARFLQSEPVLHLVSGNATVDEYKSLMTQLFYLVRENPQLQALATIYFRGRHRDAIEAFYKHAISEIGHDQLALNDFVTLGGDPADIPYRNPLPETSGLTAFAFYQIYNLNPIGYLGYLFFLEFLPTQAGGFLTEKFRSVGVPDNAMTFLRDHIEIDAGHNRLMQRYAEILLQDEKDLDCVEYAMLATSRLYEKMVAAAIKDAHDKLDTGWNWAELEADQKSPASVSKVA